MAGLVTHFPLALQLARTQEQLCAALLPCSGMVCWEPCLLTSISKIYLQCKAGQKSDLKSGLVDSWQLLEGKEKAVVDTSPSSEHPKKRSIFLHSGNPQSRSVDLNVT